MYSFSLQSMILEIVILILLIILILLAIVIVILLVSTLLKGSTDRDNLKGIIMNQQQDASSLREKVALIGRDIENQRESSSSVNKTVIDVNRALVSLNSTNDQVLDFAKSLDELQNILKDPTKRGALGEQILGNILENTLPPGVYDLQYTFKKKHGANRLRPDAIIRLREKIVPIDSKFSLTPYNHYMKSKKETKKRYSSALNTALKKQINDTSRYILPEEDTLDFAFMFIPSESLYYELLTRTVKLDKIETTFIDFAFKKQVIIVSPNTLFAYLTTIEYGLKYLQIEDNVKLFQQNLRSLENNLKKYDEAYRSIGTQITRLDKAYKAGQTDLESLNHSITKATTQQ